MVNNDNDNIGEQIVDQMILEFATVDHMIDLLDMDGHDYGGVTDLMEAIARQPVSALPGLLFAACRRAAAAQDNEGPELEADDARSSDSALALLLAYNHGNLPLWCDLPSSKWQHNAKDDLVILIRAFTAETHSFLVDLYVGGWMVDMFSEKNHNLLLRARS